VSSFLEEDGELTRRVVGLGKAPVLEGSRAAVSIRLTKQGSKILWESFRMPTPDVSFQFEMEVAGLRSPTRVLLEADWDRVYNQQAFQVGVAGTFLAGEVSGEFDKLRNDGAIRVVQVGTDEDMEKAVDIAYNKLLKIMFEPVGGSDLPQLEQMARTAGQPSMLDRASTLLASARTAARERARQIDAVADAVTPPPSAATPRETPTAAKPETPSQSGDAGEENTSGDPAHRQLRLSLLMVSTLDGLEDRLQRHVEDLRQEAAAWEDETVRASQVTGGERTARQRATKARSDLENNQVNRDYAGHQAQVYYDMMQQAEQRADELEASGESLELDKVLAANFEANHNAFIDTWIQYNRTTNRLERATRRWEGEAAAARTERGNAEVEAAALAAATAHELAAGEEFLAAHATLTAATQARATELADRSGGAELDTDSVDPRVERLAQLLANAIYMRFRLTTFLAYSDALRSYAVSHGNLTEEQAELLTFYRDPPLEAIEVRQIELLTTMQEIDQLEKELDLGEIGGRSEGPPRYSQAEKPGGGDEEARAVDDAAERGPPPEVAETADGRRVARNGDGAERVREPSFAIVGALRLRRSRQSGTLRIDLNKYTPDVQVLPFASNIGDLNRYLDNPEFFREVNLDQPLFRQRAVSFRLAGLDAEDFGEYVNFVHVQLRRGADTREELTVGAEEFSRTGNDFPLVYGFTGEESRDEWLAYEYRTVWSFFNGLEVEQPWQPGDAGAVAVAPPFERRQVEITANPEDLRAAGARAVTVRLYYGTEGQERYSEVLLRPDREIFAGLAEVILPAGEPEFEYETLWQLRGNKELTSGRLTSSASILFIDEVPSP